MRRQISRALLGNALSIGAWVAVSAATASATTWNVPGDGSNTCTIVSPNCDTIAQAVTASASSDTILIAAGSFPVAATLDLTKTLTIAGAGMASTTVQPAGGVIAFDIRADGIVLRDLTIQGGSTGVRFPVTSDNTELDHVTFSGNTSRGVDISTGPATPVTNLRIVDCTLATPNIGLRMSSNSTVSDLSITGTTFDGNAYGIYQANDGNTSQLSALTISDCTFTNNTEYGIYAEEMRDAVIESSSFSGGKTAIGLLKFYASNGLAISNVAIRGNEFTGFSRNALDLEMIALGLESPIAIEDNTFEKNVGISTSSPVVFVRLHPTLPNAAVNIVDNSIALSGTFGAATAAHGIQLRGNGPVVITGNVLDGGNVGGVGTTPPSSGIFIQSRSGSTIMPATTTISASCNRIEGFRNAVSVFDSFAVAYGGLPVGATVTVADNAILGNDSGVVSGALAPTIDAEDNYWGCAAGPGDAACDDVVGDVDADPFRTTIPACVACVQDSECDDELFCSGAETCAAGTCASGPAPCELSCNEGTDTCQTACPLTPHLCASAAKSLLLVKDKGDNTKDKLVWKWIKGDAAQQSDFADPLATADYALCIYAGLTPALVGEAIVSSDALKWSLLSTKGYKYKDPAGTAYGIAKVLLKGGEANKSKALVKGKGDGLPDLPLPLTAPVTVQLFNGDNALCWGSTFTNAQLLKNETAQLKAKAQTP